MKMIWRGRAPKAARNVIIQSVVKSGLNALDVTKLRSALRLTWVRRMCINPESDWRKLLQARFSDVDLFDILRINSSAILLDAARIRIHCREITKAFFTH